MSTAPAQTPVRVAICVVTFQRPHGLRRLLEALDGLTFSPDQPVAPEVVVVDNDPHGSAAAVCAAAPLRWPLRYECEPQRGISFVRNRAVAAARGWAELIAFIDDDEAPDSGWLAELLRVQAAYDADVVSGPVLRRFEEEVPDWIVRGHFFEDPRLATGAPVHDPATNNVLIRMSALEGVEGPFDPRYALTGGEDTHLFLRLGRAGRRMVWADEAVVHEWIPASRANARWILQRIYRGANTWSQCERELNPTAGALFSRVAKGVARVGFGLATLPFAGLFGRHRFVRSLWYVSFGAGNLTGLAGMRYQEYRTIHGR